MTNIKTPVSRVGNKSAILHILYALFPLHYGRFIDVFGGSGSVLLGKPTMFGFKRKPPTPEQVAAIETKDFFDCIAPGAIRFATDHYVVGDSYRCVWAVREYPPTTEGQAILSRLADRNGVTLRIYNAKLENAFLPK